MPLLDSLLEIPHVRCSSDGTVLRVELDRPDRENRLSYPMATGLRDLFRSLSDDRELRAVVLNGAGDSFCLGEDVEAPGEWPEEYAHRRPGGSHGAAPVPQQDLISALRAVPQPTIVKLQGRVQGLGLDLAAVCDIRVIANDCVIADGRVRDAEFAATGITHVLPRLIGHARAVRILLLGDEVDGMEAQRIGLAYRAYPAAELDRQIDELVHRLTTMATRSYAIVKQQVLDELDMPYQAALMHSMAIRQTNVIEDRQEGSRAFLEKREPNYTGR